MTRLSGIHVVIPAFHEEESIATVLQRLAQAVKIPLRVSVVCDHADDPTFRAVASVKPTLGFAVAEMVNQCGSGALNAIKTGLIRTRNDEAALVVMADGCDELEIIDDMWNLMLQGFDVVCGSRYMSGGRQIGGWWLKKLLSRSAGLTFRLFTGIGTHDITNSFKMYSPKVLRSVDIESVGGFEIGMEITSKAHRLGFGITELPTTWVDRTAGTSRFRLRKWLPHYLRWYWKGIVPGYLTKKAERSRI